MSRYGRGRCIDSIVTERLWHSLTYEAVYLHGLAARRLFLEPPWVQHRIGSTDRLLAEEWQRHWVSLEDVRHAILRGSARKAMILIDHPSHQPIPSLR